jgi:hypothetical protein
LRNQRCKEGTTLDTPQPANLEGFVGGYSVVVGESKRVALSPPQHYRKGQLPSPSHYSIYGKITCPYIFPFWSFHQPRAGTRKDPSTKFSGQFSLSSVFSTVLHLFSARTFFSSSPALPQSPKGHFVHLNYYLLGT